MSLYLRLITLGLGTARMDSCRLGLSGEAEELSAQLPSTPKALPSLR